MAEIDSALRMSVWACGTAVGGRRPPVARRQNTGGITISHVKCRSSDDLFEQAAHRPYKAWRRSCPSSSVLLYSFKQVDRVGLAGPHKP